MPDFISFCLLRIMKYLVSLQSKRRKIMRKTPFFLLLAALFQALSLSAQTVNPQAYYVNSDNVQQETRSISDGQAPLDVTFRSNPSSMDDYTPSYEWHFRKEEKSGGQHDRTAAWSFPTPSRPTTTSRTAYSRPRTARTATPAAATRTSSSSTPTSSTAGGRSSSSGPTSARGGTAPTAARP